MKLFKILTGFGTLIIMLCLTIQWAHAENSKSCDSYVFSTPNSTINTIFDSVYVDVRAVGCIVQYRTGEYRVGTPISDWKTATPENFSTAPKKFPIQVPFGRSLNNVKFIEPKCTAVIETDNYYAYLHSDSSFICNALEVVSKVVEIV